MLDLFLNILFCKLDWSIVTNIISIIASSILSTIAIIISVITLKHSSKTTFESSRANIVFYVDTLTGGQQFLTIKNFGNSLGTIINIDISPKPDYSKSPKLKDVSVPVITNYTDISLAPNQCIKSWFPFSQYPDKKFNITVQYKTLGKTYTENYPIDISYIEAIDYIRKTSVPNDIPHALKDINETLQNISERF